MENDKVQLVERLKQATNVLITVNNNPTVDQLAACIALTLLLNKLGKHGTAVFSGEVPSTLEFLKPEETIEKNTDSLRDFIISLDKAKADKLRYKVEDTMVKIFITPYKTSITNSDLEFSQGDFNVDVVLALGIHDREQLDQAIVAHGRILHDAVVMSINTQAGNNLGTINWVDEKASSLSEMLASISDDLQPQSLDPQMATAFLTGIVSETERFSNDKTTSLTMGVSSKLMAAGANQQLVATQLAPPEPEVPEPVVEPAAEVPVAEEPTPPEPEKEQEGAIIIDHPEDHPADLPELPEVDPNEINIDAEGTLKNALQLAEEQLTDQQSAVSVDPVSQSSADEVNGAVTLDPPAMGGTLTANTAVQPLEPSTDPLTSYADPNSPPILTHADQQPVFVDNLEPAEDVDPIAAANEQSLLQLEQSINAPGTVSVDPLSPDPSVVAPVEDVSDARDAVQDAINANSDNATPEPIASLNAQPVDLNMGHDQMAPPPMPSTVPASAMGSGLDSSTGQPQFPSNLVPPNTALPAENTGTTVVDPTSPPPVPPPMMPPMMPVNPQFSDPSSTSSPQM